MLHRVTPLILPDTLAALADTLTTDRPIRSRAAQRTRVHIQVSSELGEFQHTWIIGLRMTVIGSHNRRRRALGAAGERRVPLAHDACVAEG